jgi:hypothetical protein
MIGNLGDSEGHDGLLGLKLMTLACRLRSALATLYKRLTEASSPRKPQGTVYIRVRLSL